jgi:mycothiol synthase
MRWEELQQAGYAVRPAEMDDLPDVLELVNRHSRHLVGVDKYRVQDFQKEWESAGFDLARDTRLVFAPDGTLIGYGEVWDLEEPLVVIYCWGRVHPAWMGRGIGSALLQWAEERARQSLVKAPPQARLTLMAEAPHLDVCAQQMLRQAGFNLTRHTLQMVIDLGQFAPEQGGPATLPEGVTIRTMMVGKEERALFEMLRDAFRDHWGYVERPPQVEFERWMHFVRYDDRFDASLWFLAVCGDEIVGASLCHEAARGDPQMGWIRTLAVQRAWRHRGIATALLRHSFAEMRRRGKKRVGLSVDAQNLTGAIRLYEKVGMRSDPRYQFDTYEKELRPGKELRVQTL